MQYPKTRIIISWPYLEYLVVLGYKINKILSILINLYDFVFIDDFVDSLKSSIILLYL